MHIGLVSEHPVAVHVLKGTTHCRTLRKRTFILDLPQFDLDSGGRHPF